MKRNHYILCTLYYAYMYKNVYCKKAIGNDCRIELIDSIKKSLMCYRPSLDQIGILRKFGQVEFRIM